MQRDGVAPPSTLKEQPRLAVSLLLYLEAFYELDTERAYSATGAPGRIPWSKIITYALHYGYDTEEMVFFIRKMDDAFLESFMSRHGGGSGGSTGTREMVQRPPRPD